MSATTEQKLRALYTIAGDATCNGKCDCDPPCPACIAVRAISQVDEVLARAEHEISLCAPQQGSDLKWQK